MTQDKWQGLGDLKELLHSHGLRRDQPACDALESWWLENFVTLRQASERALQDGYDFAKDKW